MKFVIKFFARLLQFFLALLNFLSAPLQRLLGQFVLLVALAFVIFWFFDLSLPFNRWLKLFSPSQPTILTSDIVISQIQSMSTLVTTSFDERISVEVRNEPVIFFMPSIYESVTLEVTGKILAGIDLQRIHNEDVIVNDDEIVIYIPPAHIVSQDIRTMLVRSTDGLVQGVDPTLYPQGEARGRTLLLEAACRSGILSRAELDAQLALTDLLLKVGNGRKVQVIQQSPEPGEFTGCR